MPVPIQAQQVELLYSGGLDGLWSHPFYSFEGKLNNNCTKQYLQVLLQLVLYLDTLYFKWVKETLFALHEPHDASQSASSNSGAANGAEIFLSPN